MGRNIIFFSFLFGSFAKERGKKENVVKKITFPFLRQQQLMNNQQHTNDSFITFVEKALSKLKPKSPDFYAAESFLKFIKNYQVEKIKEISIRLWIVSMLLNGLKMQSCQRYFFKLHSLYNDWKNNDPHDPFKGLLPIFSKPLEPEIDIVNHNLNTLKRLFAKNESSDDWQMVGIFFYLLYDIGATFDDVMELKFDHSPKYCPQIDEIIQLRNTPGYQQYVFRLHQGKSRPQRIVADIELGLSSLMSNVGMKVPQTQAREEITSLWVAYAIKCGVDIRDIRSILPVIPPRYRTLSLLPNAEITEERKHEIICQVADAINDKTPRWFVMKLRRCVKYDDIKDAIKNAYPGRLSTMQLYYPTRSVIKKIKRKTVKEAIPYIPNILFFQTQYNKVRGLFSKIGDIAYCLKESNKPESRYSIISHEEMANFQKCVGKFTDDIRMELVESTSGFKKGRMVRITGGMMKDYKGKIEDINDENGTRIFYLQVTNENALKWTAEVEDVFIEPID